MKDTDELSTLAGMANGGDERDLEALVRAIWPNAYRIAWSILGDRGQAEDAAQAACAAICRNLSNLNDTRAFPAWAYRVIVSHARDHARSQMRLRLHETIGLTSIVPQAIRDDPSSRLDIESAIGRLPERLRLPLELHYFVGLSSRETGEALGLPAATVRFRLMIARRRLRPLLTDTNAPHTIPEIAP